jgi:signal transduction histidine kinase
VTPRAPRQFQFWTPGTDVPIGPRVSHRVRMTIVLLVATVLTLLSTTLAWEFTQAIGRPSPRSTLLILNGSYWYLWAAMTPAIVWLSMRFRFERGGLVRALLVHLPAVVVFSVVHVAAMQAVQAWVARSYGRPFVWSEEVERALLQTFDWEMMTYWALVGLSHALLYYREARLRALRAAQLETKLAEAELTALQQQLQPHFLFNTLHAISTLMHRDVEAADRTLMRLSDLLRMTLDNVGRPEVTLKSELDFVAKYLEIEQMRFADRLIVRFDIQPETLDALVPTLLLQPLIENAIKHGVARKSGAGHIDVEARADGDKLRIEVTDDGQGLTEDALTALQKGLGVSTTRARLLHRFGADFRFEFHRQVEGLKVVVALPLRREADAVRSAGQEETHGHGADAMGRNLGSAKS